MVSLVRVVFYPVQFWSWAVVISDILLSLMQLDQSKHSLTTILHIVVTHIFVSLAHPVLVSTQQPCRVLSLKKIDHRL